MYLRFGGNKVFDSWAADDTEMIAESGGIFNSELQFSCNSRYTDKTVMVLESVGYTEVRTNY